MSVASGETMCPAPERFFDLQEGSLPPAEAAALKAHIAECSRCRSLNKKARRISELAPDALRPRIDEQTEERLWDRISPAAARIGQQQARRHAARVLAASPYGRVAAAAALVLLLGAGLTWLLAPGWMGLAPNREMPTRPPPAAPPGRTNATGQRLAETHSQVSPGRHSPAPRKAAATPRASHRAAPSRIEPVRAVHSPILAPAARAQVHHPGSRARLRPHESSPLQPAERALARKQTRLVRCVSSCPQKRALARKQTLACGARILAQRGVVRVTRDSPEQAVLRLLSGEVTLKVPRRSPRLRVAVVTSDARVWVKGTRFTVRKNQDGTTSVGVAEGVVWLRPTGRARQTIVLGPGDTRRVQGEAAYLAVILDKMRRAASERDLHQVVRLGRRYLAVTTRPRRGGEVRLTLAGALEGLGRGPEAARQYLRVAQSSSAGPITRQNALAYLARYYGRVGLLASALATWRRLLKAFPSGVHSREALLALLRASCRSASAEARWVRTELAHRFPAERAVADALRRCGAPSR